MKQILQNLGSGETSVVDAPFPRATTGSVVVASRASLISAGTERMLVSFGRSSLLQKARSQPDKVRKVIDKIQTEGLINTIESVRSKLDQPIPLGYSNAGVVIEVGAGVGGIKAGDRVVTNGPHAEVVRSPANLCCRIPDNVSDEAASFAVVGAIGLQAIRLAAPTMGETFVVTGLGLIGLLTCQLLIANGCQVIGLDMDPAKVALAKGFGAQALLVAEGVDPVAYAMDATKSRGVDGVIIAASTSSHTPIEQAAKMCRKRGRIILLGIVELKLDRALFYEKELSFQVSCSYGPGRYDLEYEERGRDYPFGFVRWTAQRNFEAVLDQIAAGTVGTDALVTHRFDFDDAVAAYGVLASDSKALGIVLRYREQSTEELQRRTIVLPRAASAAALTGGAIGMIGAGNYATRMLLPAFKAAGAEFGTLVTTGSAAGSHGARKFGFRKATTDVAEALNDTTIGSIVIATRHDTHADLVIQAIAKGKDVFVEKPLALTLAEVDEVAKALSDRASISGSAPRLMIGFNRRFSPLVETMRGLLAKASPKKAFIYTCSAGQLPADHWAKSDEVGGGRIIGEACHFIDLIRFLAGTPIADATMTVPPPALAGNEDLAIITLRFDDGSIGTIQYFSNGGSRFPKERLEVFSGGGVLQLDNYVSLRGFDWPGFRSRKLWRQDKGQVGCARAFIDAARNGGPSPIPLDEIFEVARAVISITTEPNGYRR